MVDKPAYNGSRTEPRLYLDLCSAVFPYLIAHVGFYVALHGAQSMSNIPFTSILNLIILCNADLHKVMMNTHNKYSNIPCLYMELTT